MYDFNHFGYDPADVDSDDEVGFDLLAILAVVATVCVMFAVLIAIGVHSLSRNDAVAPMVAPHAPQQPNWHQPDAERNPNPYNQNPTCPGPDCDR